jgi:branched-chain amino acid transport system substrate-binding protein
MRNRLLVAAAAVATAVVASGPVAVGAGTLRVGVIVDCVGLLRGDEDQMLAGAELPFLERGARLRSSAPADGVTDARLAGGRKARLVLGCDESGEYSTLIAAARRLVEQEHVDVLVGGVWPGDGIVLDRVARRYPGVPFVVATAGPQEVTLGRPAPNLVRFRPSFGQEAAGLGVYARAVLGWRRAAVLAEDVSEDPWGEAAAFAAEFCAAGGRLVQQTTSFPLTVTAAAARSLARRVDGVVVLSSAFSNPAAAVATLSRALGNARRVVVGLEVALDPRTARVLDGVVSPELVPPPGSTWRAFDRRVQAAFPGLPTGASRSWPTVEFDTSVEAALEAAEAGGDLRTALARISLHLPAGVARLDADGQAVLPLTLVRHTRGGVRPVAHLAAVSQTLGGLLDRADPPSAQPRPCERAPLPAYARSLVSRR